MSVRSSPTSPRCDATRRLAVIGLVAALAAASCKESPPKQEPPPPPATAGEGGQPSGEAAPIAGAPSRMGGQGEGGQGEGAATKGPAGSGAPDAVAPPPKPVSPAVTSTHLRRILDVYEPVRVALAADDHYKAREVAINLGVTLAEAQGPAVQAAIEAARAITQHKTIDNSRAAFATLTAELWPMVAASPEIAGAVRGYRCSGAGAARWLQLAGSPIDSPYLGPTAAECGEEIPLN